MEMERFEASQRGWPQAPYTSKLETDANFHRMVDEAMKPENIAAVRRRRRLAQPLRPGLSPWCWPWRTALLDKVQFEMLEGMANAQRRALFEATRNLLLYAPVCHKEDFINAIGYLIRRLDENTGPENFLRYAFRITAGQPGVAAAGGEVRGGGSGRGQRVCGAPRRTQNRQLPPARLRPPSPAAGRHLENEPDTDFSLPHNSDWAKRIVAAWRLACAAPRPPRFPSVVAGEEILRGPTGPRVPRPVAAGRRRGPLSPGRQRRRRLRRPLRRGRSGRLAEHWRRQPASSVLGRVAEELRRRAAT